MTLNKEKIVCFSAFSGILLFTGLLIINPRYCSIFLLPAFLYLGFKTLMSRKWLFFILTSIFTMLPQLNRYGILPYLSTKLVFFLLIVSLIYLLVKFRYNHTYFIWILFTLIIVSQVIRGKYYNYDSFYLLNGSIKLIFYPVGFFFAVSLFKDKKFNENFLKSLLLLFLIIGFVVSLQTIGYHLFLTHGNRVITRQTNILLISLIVSLSLIYFYKLNTITKAILIALSILYVLGIFLSMQRSLFVATIVSVLFFTVICIKTAKKKSKTIVTLIIIVSIVTAAMFIITPNLTFDKNISSRSGKSLQAGIETPSLQIRLLTYLRTYHIIKKNVLFGQGVGDTIILPYLNQRVINSVDNSYLVIIWKLGLSGFLVFASIYFIFIKKAVYIIRNSKNRLYLVTSIVLLSSIVGQLVTGLACTIMCLYHFNFIWGALIGVIYYLYDEVRACARE